MGAQKSRRERATRKAPSAADTAADAVGVHRGTNVLLILLLKPLLLLLLIQLLVLLLLLVLQHLMMLQHLPAECGPCLPTHQMTEAQPQVTSYHGTAAAAVVVVAAAAVYL